MKPRIEGLVGRDAFYEEVFRRTEEVIVRSLETRQEFHLAVSGGSTPGPLFDLMAVRWSGRPWVERIHWWWVDERMVPPDRSESNRGAAEDRLIRPLGLRPDRVHPIPFGDDSGESASAYRGILSEWAPREHHRPHLDLVLLGMGPDGHTASLFPGQESFWTPGAWVLGVPAPESADPRIPRVTLSPEVLENAARLWLLTSWVGREKVLDRILGSEEPDLLPSPAARLSPRGEWIWFLLEE